MNPWTLSELQKINPGLTLPTPHPDFRRRLTDILTRHCTGIDDHGPGMGPDGDKHGICDKCVEMREQIMAAL